MSAPAERLCGDRAAETFELNARAILSSAPLCGKQIEDLALAVVLLAEDRRARMELAAIERLERAA